MTTLIFLLGLITGGAAAFFFLQSKFRATSDVANEQLRQGLIRQNELAKNLSEKEARNSDLQRLYANEVERRSGLEAENKRIAQLDAELATLDDQIESLQARLNQEISQRSTAEEKARQIPGIEQVLDRAEKQIQTMHEQNAQLRERLSELEATLEAEQSASQERDKFFEQNLAKLNESFGSLSQQALQANNTSFMHLAKSTFEQLQESAKGDLRNRQQAIDELVKPLRENLDKLDHSQREMERLRTDAYSSLQEQVKMLRLSDEQLRSETTKLVTALRAPKARGQWGEIQLQRVVEMAGMSEHCNYNEQVSMNTADGKSLIADMIVHLPGGKSIIVDSKAPLDAYLDAIEATDEEQRKIKMQLLCNHIRKHVTDLDGKAYWKYKQPAPEFVVLFMPSESVFHAALQYDPSLMEFSINKRVLLTSPTTLIGMLKSISYGWSQEAIAQEAQSIAKLAREVYDRFRKVGEHLAKLGKNLNDSVSTYNQLVSSTETRLLVSVRKFRELGVARDQVDIAEVPSLNQITSTINAPELLEMEEAEKMTESDSLFPV